METTQKQQFSVGQMALLTRNAGDFRRGEVVVVLRVDEHNPDEKIYHIGPLNARRMLPNPDIIVHVTADYLATSGVFNGVFKLR